MHKEASQRIEDQYNRLLEDITHALKMQKEEALKKLSASESKTQTEIKSYMENNKKVAKKLEDLSSNCQSLAEEKSVKLLLMRANQVDPLMEDAKKTSAV